MNGGISHGILLDVLYISAFVIWLQGYPDQPLCNPDSLIQPHGIWHILCSLATLSFFVFLRTEQIKKRGLTSLFLNITYLPAALTGITKDVFNTSLIPLTFLENFQKLSMMLVL